MTQTSNAQSGNYLTSLTEVDPDVKRTEWQLSDKQRWTRTSNAQSGNYLTSLTEVDPDVKRTEWQLPDKSKRGGPGRQTHRAATI